MLCFEILIESYLKNIEFQINLITFKTSLVSAVTFHLFGRDFLDSFDLNQTFYCIRNDRVLRTSEMLHIYNSIMNSLKPETQN